MKPARAASLKRHHAGEDKWAAELKNKRVALEIHDTKDDPGKRDQRESHEEEGLGVLVVDVLEALVVVGKQPAPLGLRARAGVRRDRHRVVVVLEQQCGAGAGCAKRG